jgi:hypothetical protein
MTKRTADMPGPTEFEIETRGMAIAADVLNDAGHHDSASILVRRVLERQSAFRKAMEEKS